ncbi:MAG TPA: DUF5985 family protein [Steroidobacteraceae bacterium]|jgi:hypothetical protein
MAEIVYALCGLTSIACAVLLFRKYRISRARLLFWASLCFIGLAVNNVLLFVDLVLFPAIDLSGWRTAAALAGMTVLVYGLVLESR